MNDMTARAVHSKLDYCKSLYHNLPNYQLKTLLLPLLSRLLNRGGAADFKVGGTKQDSRAERAKKNLYPHFSKCGGIQASKYQ